ncbi:AAA family ATPase [Vibrio splendidus]|uniref:ATP-binding protein n=1 Tax=Vibrio splendidus TaxID=29497 RepID=A0AB35N0Q9_VIBSP|nr:ATP-binding protein [Vibrio splendidus]MDP2502154.1 ATP-binding protein [Vibrio splendidus]PMM75532.1 AAA family ATPase [Vibrio splendidus]
MEALEAARAEYRGWGREGTGYRNNVMIMWGGIVGKSRALGDLDNLIRNAGTRKLLSEEIQLSEYSLKLLEKRFKSLPDRFKSTNVNESYKFIEGEKCQFEEDATHEFKEVKGHNPTKSIQNVVDEYIIAFLNSSGGSIFWGICDDTTVKSIPLCTAQKDEIRKAINSKLRTLEPQIDPTQIGVIFHNVTSSEDGYVVEVTVPRSNSDGLFFNSSGNTWVRLNGCKQKLQGLALQDYIIKRVRNGN